jgi:small subunit ribosomal protein S20
MANHFSALKRVRIETRRTEFNRQAKSRLRHQIRAMRKALAGKEQKVTAEEMSKTFSLVDRSARAGIIKKNAAARYKARLHARVKKALQPA